MDSPTPSPNRDERPQRPAAASDREREHDRRPAEPEAGAPDASRHPLPHRAPSRRFRVPRTVGTLRMLGRSAGAGVAGALIGITLALLLPARPHAPAATEPAPASDAVPPAPATRDEALARRRTLEAADAADTRPDDHTLARRDRAELPARAAE